MYYMPEPLNPKKDLGRFSATCFTYLWVMLASVFVYAFVAFFRYYARARYGYPKDPGSSH